MRDSKALIEVIRFGVCLGAGRRGRIVAEPPAREEAKAKLEAWRASREHAKCRQLKEQETAELDEIAALEAALRSGDE